MIQLSQSLSSGKPKCLGNALGQLLNSFRILKIKTSLVCCSGNKWKKRLFIGAVRPWTVSAQRKRLRHPPGSGMFSARGGNWSEKLHVVAQQDDPEEIKHAVSQGLGIAIVSELDVLDYEKFQMIQVFRFPHPSLKRKLYLVTHKSHVLSNPVQRLRAFVRDYAKNRLSGSASPR